MGSKSFSPLCALPLLVAALAWSAPAAAPGNAPAAAGEDQAPFIIVLPDADSGQAPLTGAGNEPVFPGDRPAPGPAAAPGAPGGAQPGAPSAPPSGGSLDY